MDTTDARRDYSRAPPPTLALLELAQLAHPEEEHPAPGPEIPAHVLEELAPEELEIPTGADGRAQLEKIAEEEPARWPRSSPRSPGSGPDPRRWPLEELAGPH